MPGLTDFQRTSIAAALVRTLTAERFSVCDVRTCARTADLPVHEAADFQALRLWNAERLDDTPGLRAGIQRITLGLFAASLGCSTMDGLRRAAGLPADDAPTTPTGTPAPHGWTSVSA